MRSRGRPAWPQCTFCAWLRSSARKASAVCGKVDAVGANLREEAEFRQRDAQRLSGTLGLALQLGLLYVREGPVRRVLAHLPPCPDHVCSRRADARIQLLGSQDVTVLGAPRVLLGGHQALQGGPHGLDGAIWG